ncbi:hypothetical protein V8F33_009925 [Rhypophila sp. PSN 637]
MEQYQHDIINNSLFGQACFIHLLGHSSFSTVWLAHDNLTYKYVAVKVCTADSDAANRESEVLSRLSSVAITTQNAGKSMIQTLLDRFTVSGPNGHHICLVSNPTRGSLYGAPVSGSSDSPEGIVAIDLSIRADQLTLSQARITQSNLRSSFNPQNEVRYQSHAPVGLHPPNLFLPPYPTLNFASDIWSLGAAIFELLGVPLIDTPRQFFILSDQDCQRLADELGREPTDEECTIPEKALQANGLNRIDAHGKRIIPTDWWDTTGYMDHLDWDRGYKSGRDWRYDSGLSELDTLESQLHYGVWEPRGAEIGEEERDMILSMLRTLLAFKSADRPNAEGVLKLEWMRKYALPAYEQVRRAWN